MKLFSSMRRGADVAVRSASVRAAGRAALQAWAGTCTAPGYLYQAMEAYGPSLSDGGRLPSRLPDGSMIECDLRDHVERQMYFLGAYEPIEAYLFTRLVRPGLTVVDAGANVGQYTLLAASGVGPTGAVHCFEPVAANFARLEAHLAANRVINVRANRSALWHEPAEVRLGLPADTVGNAGSFSVGSLASSVVAALAEPLDAYDERMGVGRVDLVKMDIEGAEWAALRGCGGPWIGIGRCC